MSTFLGYENFQISLGASIETVKSTIRNALTSRGWQVVAESAPVQAIIAGGFTNGSYPASNVFDLDCYTPASVNGALPITVGVQAASAFTPTKMRVGGGPTAAQSPHTFTLDYSDDGSTWTTLQTWKGQTQWQTGEQRIFTVTGAGAHVYWRLSITGGKSPVDSYTSISSFHLEDASNRKLTSPVWLEVIPPNTETIGNAASRELLHIEFGSNYIRFIPVQEILQFQPMTIALWPKTAGAVACGLTLSDNTWGDISASISGTTLTVTGTPTITLGIGSPITGVGVLSNTVITGLGTGAGGAGTYTVNNSQTVAATTLQAAQAATVTGAAGTSGSTAAQNLRALYEAIRNSSDPRFTAFNWSYQYAPPQNANDTNEYIYGTAKTLFNNVVVTPNANVNGACIGSSGAPQKALAANSLGFGTNCDLTSDLVSGFVYYLQVCSRGIAMATKTNANFFGPIHASFTTNSRAIASIPVNSTCTPVELFVGFDGANTVQSSTAYASHGWAMHDSTIQSAGIANFNYVAATFSGAMMRDVFYDRRQTSGVYSNTSLAVTLVGSGFANADTATDDFQIHRMNQAAMGFFTETTTSGGGVGILPILDVQDWYKFRGTATNESLMLVADTVAVSTLATAIDNVTAITQIDLVDASSYPTAGTAVIENETFTYTGKSGNSLTGVSRAQYATSMATHFVGTQVNAGLWLVVINGGALLAGYVKPS